MSILLDSLRKSEAQRKIKDAPSIHSSQPYGSGQARASRWLPLLMVGVAAIAIAWFGWRQYAPPASDPSPPAQADAGMQPQAGQVTTVDATTPGPESVSAQPRTPVERLSRDGAGQGSADSGAVDDAPGDLTPSDRIASYAAPDEPESPVVEPGPGASEERDADAEVSAEQDARPDADAIDELADAGRQFPEDAVAGRPGPAEPEYMSYWQLPSSWRDEMPELRITVLVYAEDSEDRFLLVGGERLQEGDELEGGVVLEEIRRDGAVFSYRSRQFMVKS